MHKAVTIVPPFRKRGGHNWSPGWEWETKGELPFRTDWLATVLLQAGSGGSGWWVLVALDLDESHVITCQFSPTRRPFLYPVGREPANMYDHEYKEIHDVDQWIRSPGMQEHQRRAPPR